MFGMDGVEDFVEVRSTEVSSGL